jgi:hypothetical protein
LVFREDDNDHFYGGKPGEPIIFPCKVTHPNVSLSLFRQTRETTVQFQNEYFKVFRTDSTPENAFGQMSDEGKKHSFHLLFKGLGFLVVV